MALVKCRTFFNQEKWIPAESLVQRPSVYGLIIQKAQLLVVQVQHTQRYVLPGGQSGDPSSPHYDDMLPLWSRGEGVAIAWSPEAVERATLSELSLLPLA